MNSKIDKKQWSLCTLVLLYKQWFISNDFLTSLLFYFNNRLKYGFCKKLLRYYNEPLLNTFFLTFFPDQHLEKSEEKSVQLVRGSFVPK